jgi:hypothetical protein
VRLLAKRDQQYRIYLAAQNGRDVPHERHPSIRLQRREQINRILVPKRVVRKVDSETREVVLVDDDTKSLQSKKKGTLHMSDDDIERQKYSRKKSNIVLRDDNTTDESSSGVCSICLGEYQEGEEIYWSHNRRCNHCFHRACIEEWLLRTNACPCCRSNYLARSDDGSVSNADEETITASRVGGGDFLLLAVGQMRRAISDGGIDYTTQPRPTTLLPNHAGGHVELQQVDVHTTTTVPVSTADSRIVEESEDAEEARSAPPGQEVETA